MFNKYPVILYSLMIDKSKRRAIINFSKNQWTILKKKMISKYQLRSRDDEGIEVWKLGGIFFISYKIKSS